MSIRPAGHDYQLPALTYHFYNTDTEKEHIVRSSDALGNFDGELPVGTYRVIATNTGAANVGFEDMHNHELARVVTKSTTRDASGTYLTQPGMVYSIPMPSVSVSDKSAAAYEPEPVELTRRLTMDLVLEGSLIQEVTGISGEMCGVVDAVNLFTCQPAKDETDRDTNMRVIGEGTSIADGAWQIGMDVFGIYDPENGEAYESKLIVSLDLLDDTTVQVEVELTDILSDVVEWSQGEIPTDIPLEISFERTDAGVTAKVSEWDDAGKGEGELKVEN